MSDNEQIVIGLVSISDRASQGVYKDEGLPALDDWLGKAIRNSRRIIEKLIPDEQPVTKSRGECSSFSAHSPMRRSLAAT